MPLLDRFHYVSYTILIVQRHSDHWHLGWQQIACLEKQLKLTDRAKIAKRLIENALETNRSSNPMGMSPEGSCSVAGRKIKSLLARAGSDSKQKGDVNATAPSNARSAP